MMKGIISTISLMILVLSTAFSQTISEFSCTPRPVYGHRKDGKPGRELLIQMIGSRFSGNEQIETVWEGKKETTRLSRTNSGDSVCTILLPHGLGVDKSADVLLTVTKSDRVVWKKKVVVPAMRYWTVFLYNHSHVDIGYTNTQKNVELLHRTNVLEGIKLANLTAHFPKDSRYKWNPEVTWPVERLWYGQPEVQPTLIRAIRQGKLNIDASYLNTNTSIAADEEMFHLFRFSRFLQRQSGVPVDVFQQVDVPGMSWGIVPVMAQEGVKYVVSWINGGDRVGNAHRFGINGRPFWWLGPDGKSKVLFFQPGGYGNPNSVDKGGKTGRPWFGQRDVSKIPAVITTGSANVDFTDRLSELEKSAHPYDFLALSWSLWDNTPLDADIPYAVKAWNERYAYPKIKITGGRDMMQYIEKKYGDSLPVVKGDYTEYWTDGLGSAAKLTAMNRNSKERLIQSEKLWSMLGTHRGSPRTQMDEAWRKIALGSEHTWCFENPWEPYFQDAIFKRKQDYFEQAEYAVNDIFDDSFAPITDKSNGGIGPLEGPSAGGIVVLNTNSWEHGGLVTLNKSESIRGDKVVDEAGADVPAQRLSSGELAFMASRVPAFGSRHYRVVKGKSDINEGCSLKENILENGKLRVIIDKTSGNITELVDLATGYNYAGEDPKMGLNSFHWLPGNIDGPVPDSLITIKAVEAGPIVVEIEISSKAKGVRSVTRKIRLVTGQQWVGLDNVVDKLPLLEKDGIHFGFNFNLPEARTRIDIPWGVMEVEKDQWPQANRNWFAMQRWVDITNGSKGITWCSLDAPLLQYGKMTANNAHGWGNGGNWIEKLTPSSTIYSWAMNNHWHTNFPLSQDGPVRFRYKIMPHGAYNAAMANRFGMEQSQPLVHVPANNDPKVTPFVNIDNEKLVVSIIKPTNEANTYVIRLRSLSDKEEVVNLNFPRQPRSVYLCGLEEAPLHAVNGPIKVGSFGMTTIKVVL